MHEEISELAPRGRYLAAYLLGFAGALAFVFILAVLFGTSLDRETPLVLVPVEPQPRPRPRIHRDNTPA